MKKLRLGELVLTTLPNENIRIEQYAEGTAAAAEGIPVRTVVVPAQIARELRGRIGDPSIETLPSWRRALSLFPPTREEVEAELGPEAAASRELALAAGREVRIDQVLEGWPGLELVGPELVGDLRTRLAGLIESLGG